LASPGGTEMNFTMGVNLAIVGQFIASFMLALFNWLTDPNITSYNAINNKYSNKNTLIDHSPHGAFQGQWKQMMKQLMQINITWFKIPTGRR